MAAFTTIAAGVGLAATAGSTAMSFINASKQSRLQREAEAKAAKAMAEARKRLEINYAKGLAINKEPYELAREAMLSAGAQAIQAGQESERGAVATAGKVYMAQSEAQGGIREEMGKELTDIQKQILDEESRLRDLNVQLDLGQVAGAQQAAADAQEAKTIAQQQGFEGLVSTIKQGINMIPLFAKGDVTDFSPEGGQVTVSEKKGGIKTDIPGAEIARNPSGARFDDSLLNSPWEYNPFSFYNYSAIRR